MTDNLIMPAFAMIAGFIILAYFTVLAIKLLTDWAEKQEKNLKN